MTDVAPVPEIRLAIVGSRTMTDEALLARVIDEALAEWGQPDVQRVISGGARGADSLGETWARRRRIPITVYKPDWKRLGKRAGIERNKDIIADATHVVAFPSHKGRGTQHSIELADEAGKPCWVHYID